MAASKRVTLTDQQFARIARALAASHIARLSKI
jgi:hypothetical protein